MKGEKWILVLVAVIIVGAGGSTLCAAEEEPPRVTMWAGPDKKPLHSPLGEEFPLRLDLPASGGRVSKGEPESVLGRICIVVGQDLYPDIASFLVQYQADLHVMGYTGMVHVFSSGTPQALRDHLRTLYQEPGSLAGAVFIGNIPYIVYEMMQTWTAGDPAEYEDFPCDLFFMDLDGSWSDVLDEGQVRSGNGKYDTREGNLDLEIWVSRIRTDNLPLLGANADLAAAYFEKNHRYRRQELVPGQNALAYNDDDWWDMTTSDADRIGWVYPDSQVTAVADPDVTTASDFKAIQLPSFFEFISIRSHGWTGGHGFYRNQRSIFERVYAGDYASIDPQAVFHSLFVCSGSDYTASDNLAGTIAFNPADSGLLAVGTTKTGGMWNENRFYSVLSDGEPFGEAFRQWLNSVIYRSDAPRWWYGMVLIGDGTLVRSRFMEYPCSGDGEGDQDVDGRDLAAVIGSSGTVSPVDLFLFSQDFGKTDCP